MEEKNFIICDSEKEYGIRFMERMEEHSEFYVQVRLFQSVEEVAEFLKSREIYILLIEETFPKEEREKLSCRYRFVLVREGGCELAAEETAVRKYQPAEQILGTILESCLAHQETALFRMIHRERRVIGFYSPVQDGAQTRMAVALGEELAKSEEVLYLNFQPYPGWSVVDKETDGSGLAELIYYVRQGDTHIGVRAGAIKQRIGRLAYIPPIENGEDLKMVEWEEWKTLLEQILGDSIYQVIILDLPECVQGLLKMLELCGEIYMQNARDEIGHAKIAGFCENLEQMGKKRLLEKIHPAEE